MGRFVFLLLGCSAVLGAGGGTAASGAPAWTVRALAATGSADSSAGDWSDRPPAEWPQITMINEIEYAQKRFPIAGCAFLLDTGEDTLAVTAKHILTFFKSDTMEAVTFAGTLIAWRMYPKDHPQDVVVVEQLINEDPQESIDRIPSSRDWLLFTIRESSPKIQPLQMRASPLQPGEPVYIVGWRYSDKDCPQVVYEGAIVREEEGSIIISTRELADNTMPGLSGSPVIDANGRVIGLMSQKAGKHERVASLSYPRAVLAQR